MSLFDFLLGRNGQTTEYPIVNTQKYGRPDEVFTPMPKPIMGVDMTKEDYNNLKKDGLLSIRPQNNWTPIPQLTNGVQPENSTISTGLNAMPEKRGLLQDLISGFRENANTPFQVENLRSNKDKGLAYKIGEGFGTAGRFIASPEGRMALTAGIVGASGGSGLQALGYGTTAGVTNQKLRTQDQLYRNQLKQDGINTDNIGGYINADDYKNIALNSYRKGMLDLGNKRLTHADYQKARAGIDKMFQNGEYSVNEYKERIAYLNKRYEEDELKSAIEAGNVQDSNETKLTPAKKAYYESMPVIAGGRLGLQQAEFAVDAPLKQVQTQKALMELQTGGIPLDEYRKMTSGVTAIENQLNRFSDSFKGLPTKAESYTAGQVRNLTGMQTKAEANFNSQRTLLFNKIARELGGEKGVLSDQDIARVEKSLPNLTDSYEQKQAKMQAVYDLLNDTKNKYGMNQQIQEFTPNVNMTPIQVPKKQQSKPTPKTKTQTKQLSPLEQEMKRRGLL